MEAQIASGNGKPVYNDYITAINKYLIEFLQLSPKHNWLRRIRKIQQVAY